MNCPMVAGASVTVSITCWREMVETSLTRSFSQKVVDAGALVPARSSVPSRGGRC